MRFRKKEIKRMKIKISLSDQSCEGLCPFTNYEKDFHRFSKPTHVPRPS